jgi:hypothetical protein
VCVCVCVCAYVKVVRVLFELKMLGKDSCWQEVQSKFSVLCSTSLSVASKWGWKWRICSLLMSYIPNTEGSPG